MPKENPTDQDIKQTSHQCPEMTNLPIARLIDWVSEVRLIPVKEERRVLWYASDGLSGEMGCLRKPDD